LTAKPIQTTSFTANRAIYAYGSDHYELQVALSSDPSFSAPVYANLNVAGLTYNVTGLTRGTAYLFRVRGVNSDGNPGDYATSGGFSTLSIPNLTTSNGGSTVTAWENNGGAAGNPINYSVNYVLSGDFVKVSIPVNYSPSLSSNLDISATPIPVDFYFLNVLTYPTPSLAGCIPANKFGTVQITSLLAGNSTLVSSTGSGLQIPLTLPNGKYTLCWVVRDPNSGDQFAAYISTHLTVTDYLFYLEGVIPVIQPKISVLPDKPFELPINIEKIDGKQITQFSGFVVYDSSILRFKPQLYKAGSLTQNWDVAISSDREGIVNVSGKGTDPIDKNGILCKVTFDVIGSVGKVSQILLADFMLNSKPVIPVDGTVTVTADVTKVTDLRAIPTECTLQQNYPNPFNPATTITYALATDAFVTLKVYDALGREVKTLDKGNKSLGYHDIVFDAKNLTSGVYYYVLNISGKENNKLLIKKMILLK
jgi:hypothetical protein